MPQRSPRPYQLTSALVASSAGAGVLCLAAEGIGRTYRLHAQRPGPELNRAVRADFSPNTSHVIAVVAPPKPALIRVDISGPIEQFAGYHDPCGGFSDGNDAIAERLCAAFAEADVELVVNTPGGVCAGAQQGIAKALAAKAKHGRRCTGLANEQIGSLGMWWTLALCDELFIPEGGQLGSIGARAGHLDISGAMAKAGEVMTYFAWPNAGKIALAPEFPLSDLGKARGDRDVAIVGEAFCAAVIGSPIGVRYGLTRDAVIALGADMLTGQAAKAAGLCDDIATEDEVTTYALKAAETATKTSSSAQARAPGDSTMRLRHHLRTADGNEATRARAGGDEEPDLEAPEKVGTEPDGSCSSCGAANEPNAKFCDQCGESMAAKPIDGDDEEPMSSKPAALPAARMSVSAPLADVLGLAADASLPAQKAAALDLRQVFDHASKLTGQKGAAGIVGGLTAIAHDASQSGRLRAERNEIRKTQETADRLDLCKRLVACGAESRGRVFVDTVSDDGKRVAGPPTLAPVFAEMRIATLRGLVEGHEKNAAPRSPFEPDRAAAEAAAKDVKHTGGVDEKTRLERAKKDPAVLRIFNHPNNTFTLDDIASQYVKTLATLGGAP